MIYEYKDLETGEVLELYQPASESVPIGEVIEKDGRRLERLFPSHVQTTMGELGVQDKYPYKLRSQSRDIDCPKDKNGIPVVESRQHERELQARHNLEKT